MKNISTALFETNASVDEMKGNIREDDSHRILRCLVSNNSGIGAALQAQIGLL